MRCCAIDGAPLSISGCPVCVTVVGDVRFEVLAHLNYIHYAMKRAVQCERWGQVLKENVESPLT